MMVTASTAIGKECSRAGRIVWEESACPLCGDERHETVFEGPDVDPSSGGLRFAIVRCCRCHLHFTNPRPDAESMQRFYQPGYPAFHRPKLLQARSRRWYPFARIFGRPCRERRVLPWHGQGRLLDFGCGGGKFLLRMQDQGWKVTGLDRSAEIVQQVRDKLGINARIGTLPNQDIDSESFDIITMWSTLAHVHQPLAALQEAYRILAPGGRLYVEVPNIESWAFRWFGDSWAGLDLPRHLTHFSKRSLRDMLERAGFRVLSISSVSHPDWLRASARQKRASLISQLLRLKPMAHFASWMAYLAGRADGIMSVAERA